MKLLLENWRKYLNEDWRETSWEADDEKVTIGDVVDYLGDETVDINVLELSQQLPPLPTRGAERVAAASLEYASYRCKERRTIPICSRWKSSSSKSDRSGRSRV